MRAGGDVCPSSRVFGGNSALWGRILFWKQSSAEITVVGRADKTWGQDPALYRCQQLFLVCEERPLKAIGLDGFQSSSAGLVGSSFWFVMEFCAQGSAKGILNEFS